MTQWLASLVFLVQAEDVAWVDAMKKVHAKFTGQKGTFAQFGDSITITMAFWSSLRGGGKNMTPETVADYKRVEGHMKPECWSGWKGPAFGNQGTMTIRWAHENVGKWLEKLNPEVALIMFGTNDLTSVPLEEYEAKTRDVVRTCLDNGTIAILTTIPPRHGLLEKSKAYAEAARKVARELRVPLCDYSAECLRRRPEDWDGAADAFKDYKDYDVPTLLARDGVHPSNPKAFAGDYSDEGLRSHGFVLRNYVSLRSYAAVIRDVLAAK
ncbi:MAG TPA: SGNH/GDSL hydrolase family protein [Planctomycetota bacterium]